MQLNSRGFTITEVMIALVVNVIILLGLISVFSANTSNTAKTTDIDELSQQMEVAMQLMANDIRRAGYWGNADSDLNTGVNSNPYMATGMDITVPSSSCILFSYDYSKNGSVPAISSSYDDERYGYRLSGQTLQARPPGASFSCTAAASAWENVTDATIVQITALSFTLNSTTVPVGATSKTMLVRSVDISMTGTLVSNTSVTKTLTQHVRIMNGKYVP